MMDWTLKDNMVDDLFFCATLTDRRGVHTPFVQAGVETPDTGAEAIKPDPGSSRESHSGRVGASTRKCLRGLNNLRSTADYHRTNTVLSGDGGWQVRDVDVEEKGRQDRSLWDAVLEAS